jgi:MOSC domain-containing protein YiiM
MKRIESIAISPRKGTRKIPVTSVCLLPNYGLKGDAHAGPWHRQVSFLAQEAIDRIKAKGLKVGFGDFAENIATSGIHWPSLPLGTKVRLGETAVVVITQIGKTCHTKCAIYPLVGDCIMPREGVFGKVLVGGWIHTGDQIVILGG